METPRQHAAGEGKSATSTAPASKARLPQLDHLTGARCLAAIWVVSYHFLFQGPGHPPSIFTAARVRANSAVNFFVVMSGFVTHWVYSTQMFEGWPDLKNFYVRRLSRIVLTTWAGLSFGLLVAIVRNEGLGPWHLVRCYCFVESWLSPVEWCPNGEVWTVFALIPSWLLYPVTRRVVAAAESACGTAGLVFFAVLMWLATIVPTVVFFVRGGFAFEGKFTGWLYEWPGAQLPDFVLGVATAALAQRHSLILKQPATVQAARGLLGVDDGRAHWFCGLLADVSMVVVALVVFFVPLSSDLANSDHKGYEPFVDHGFGLLYACFLYGSAAGGGAGQLARLLKHPGLVAFGAYSFEVYLFQMPWHEMYVALGTATGLWQMRNTSTNANDDPEGFMVFFLTLWLACGLYLKYVETPLVSWAHRHLGIESRGGGGSDGGRPARVDVADEAQPLNGKAGEANGSAATSRATSAATPRTDV